MDGREGFHRRPRDPDRLFIQPRRFLDLSHARRHLHRAGHQYAALDPRSDCGRAGVASHIEGRAWHSRFGHRDPRRDALRDPRHSRARPRADPAGGLVCRHRARASPAPPILTPAATLPAIPAIPVLGLVLILPVDWFVGIARAVTNLIGNCVATVVVAVWEKA